VILIKRCIRKIVILWKKAFWRLFNSNIRLGKNVNFRKSFEINCKKNGCVNIGNNVFFNNGCTLNVHQRVTIGDDCIFGENVKIYDHNHRFSGSDVSIQNQGYTCKDVTVGKNCWIGTSVIILAGTTIGDNVVIGAGTVVSGVVPSDVVVMQNRELVISPIQYKK